MNYSKNILGYTFFELVIVVTIIVILGTVGFVSYSEFAVSSRDGKRSTDLVTLRSALTTYSGQNGEYPNPSDAIEIRATADTGSTVLARQGVLGPELMAKINATSGGRDPSSNLPYTLTVESSGKRAQIVAYFEKAKADKQISLLWDTAYAATNLSKRTVVAAGEKLGTFILAWSLIPLQENATGSIAATSLAGSGYLILDGCLTKTRLEDPNYSNGEYKSLCNYTPYMNFVDNSKGNEGDEIEAIDNRIYTHDPLVVTANGGNPDFFNKKYKLIKMNGKWWMNQNLAYPGVNLCLVLQIH